jgi:conjugative relaxase-like TrwC/TraI family protein
MMSMSEPLSAAQTETYFSEHYSQDDYYTQGQTCIGQWIGKGAANLGLIGDVSREDFSALLQGVSPHTRAVIIPAATYNGEHRAGWDNVFSAPKSVSIQALIGGDNRLIEAHAKAVQTALAEVERYALARQRHGLEWVVSGNIVAAIFNHLAARPADEVRLPDPQLHTHVVMLNMTRRPDGEWRSLDPIKIFNAQRLGSAVYRSELALEVQRLGYHINVTQADGAWEIDGYSRDQVMAFSSRRQQILDALAKEGYSGAKAAQIAALGTRQAKRDYDEAEMKADWQQRAHEAGIDAKQHLWHALGQGDLLTGNKQDARDALDFAVRHTTNREAVVDRCALEVAALQHAMGKVDLATVRQQMVDRQRELVLIQAGPTNAHHPQGAFTTDHMLDIERENIELMRERLSQLTPPIGTAAEVQRWAEGKRLSAEQIAAAHLVLSSDKGIAAIDGFAGAAKTTTEGAIREFAEAHGYIVRGFAMTSTARKQLRDAGIKAETIASLLARPLPMPTGPEMWFIDESSLVSSEKVNRILKIAREAGIERPVFVGDQGQHQAIEAGAPIRQLLAAGMPVATLQEIRRQRDPDLREAVKIARGDGAAAFDLLQEQGRITEIADVNRRYRQIAADYLAGIDAKQQTLVVSPGNDERKPLNAEIRALLVERGHVKSRGIKHEVLVRRDMTPEQIVHFGSYQEGDVIYIGGNHAQQRQGLKRDSHVTVEAVNRDGKFLTLRTDDGRKLEASPVRWKHGDQVAAEVYTQETRTIAKGDRLQFRRPDNRRDIANGEFASILLIGSHKARIRFEGKQPRELTLPIDALRHIDYGYTVTSFSSQGSTVDKVVINDDSMRSVRLVNREEEYVSVSRARIDARIYTDDAQALRRAVARDPKKEIAMDAIRQRPTQELTPTQQTTDLQPQQRQPSTRLSITI